MYLFQRVLRRLRNVFRRKPKANFTLDVHTLRSLQNVAEREQRTPEDIAIRILDDALRDHQTQQSYWQRWQSLTPREQEVAALVCLKYTTRQIATRLYISPETVKTHIQHALLKLSVPNRHALRTLLSEWDFSDWER